MTDLVAAVRPVQARTPRPRHYLMTRPTHFTVRYAINPWMHPDVAVDTARALRQWDVLRRTYLDLGHRVEVLEQDPELPDMVYAANGALVTPTGTVGARFTYAERAAEAGHYTRWLEQHGFGPVHEAVETNEGEGDFLVIGRKILAGTGFRTSPAAHAEVAAATGMPVIGLDLVDPRYYHLDTALAVLDDHTVAYYPEAFSIASQAMLACMYPDAILATAADAAVLGLNVVSDGRNVIMTDAAPRLAGELREHGFVPVPVDLSELLKGGGSVKCCTLELRKEPAR